MPQVPHGARPVDSVGNVGFYTSMLVVSGNPAIGYYDNSNLDLKYVRAADVNSRERRCRVDARVDRICNVPQLRSQKNAILF